MTNDKSPEQAAEELAKDNCRWGSCNFEYAYVEGYQRGKAEERQRIEAIIDMYAAWDTKHLKFHIFGGGE